VEPDDDQRSGSLEPDDDQRSGSLFVCVEPDDDQVLFMVAAALASEIE
jgi:hypothetical protein